VNFPCVSVHSISGTRVCDSPELKRLRKRLQTWKAPHQGSGASPDAKFPVLLVTKHPCCSTLPRQIFLTLQLLNDGESAFALPTTDWLRALVAEASVILFLIAMDEHSTET
jgi:hypothetical protein